MSSNHTTSASASAGAANPPPPPTPASNKRKRTLPGNPDPDTEVVALSPATLTATNRFPCEVCGKGFQREQNLQLHRRGHNLPWKLKQRGGSKEEEEAALRKKKVYVCPEASSAHHHPSRALGDLTGVKKHFLRKHGEKKWRCDKCAKRYAVQSDWKAHSMICGTREYKCDCGAVFTRRDSFITHRAFCDAHTQETARAIAIAGLPPMLYSPQPPHELQEFAAFQDHHHQAMLQHCSSYGVKPEMQPWPTMPYPYDDVNHPLPLPQPLCCNATAQSPAASVPTPTQEQQHQHPQQLPAAAAAHLSATALLQKAAQMGATVGGASAGGVGVHYAHMAGAATVGATFGLGPSCLSNQQMMSLVRTASHGRSDEEGGGGASGGANDGMTRDFLGLRAFSHRDILGLAGFDSSCMGMGMGGAVNAASNNTSMAPCYEPHGQPQQQSSNEPWHGTSSHS